MFTGIVEEIGKIEQTTPLTDGLSLTISAKTILEDLNVNDSVCVDGVCLTVTKIENPNFWVDAVGATLQKTTFAKIKKSQQVNLERSLRLSDRLGGHLVQGHVNGVGHISGIENHGENYSIRFSIPEELSKYLLKEGSIAINGISLTIAELDHNAVTISVIPHTWEKTNLKFKKLNDQVNIEIDILAKYVEKLLHNNSDPPKSKISEGWLKDIGYK